MPLVTLSEASRATGVSRQQLYRLRDRGALVGWLHRDAKGQPLIELQGLREHLCSWTRARVDSFHWREPPQQEQPQQQETGELTAGQLAALRELDAALQQLLDAALAVVVDAGAERERARKALEEMVPSIWHLTACWLVHSDGE